MHIDYRKLVHRYRLPGRLAAELVTLFEKHNFTPTRERYTAAALSFKTAYRRSVNLCAAFKTLHELGYTLQSLDNFQERHVRVLMQHWEQAGETAGTIQNKLTYLRTLARWIGKFNMIKDGHIYVNDPKSLQRPSATQVDKTWSGQGIEPLDLIEKIAHHDQRVAVQMLLQLALGLRVEESMLLRPMKAYQDAQDRARILIEHGTKGGRPRELMLRGQFELEVLSLAAQYAVSARTTLIPKEYTLYRWRNHYYYILQRSGVTHKGLGIVSHGLRHERLNHLFQHITGKLSPIKGGSDYDPALYSIARQTVTQEAGHNDEHKAAAYLGSVLQRLRQGAPVRAPAFASAVSKAVRS